MGENCIRNPLQRTLNYPLAPGGMSSGDPVRGSSLGQSTKGFLQVEHRWLAGAFENVSYNMSINWLMRVFRWSWSAIWLLSSNMSSSFSGLKRGGRVGQNSGIVESGGGAKTRSPPRMMLMSSNPMPMSSALAVFVVSLPLLLVSWAGTLESK